MRALRVLLLACWALPAVAAAPPYDVRALADWSGLPLLTTPKLLEVCNTRGPNAGRVMDVTPGTAVIFDEQGPGCLQRLLVGSIDGTLKLFFDGSATPQLELPLAQLYHEWPSDPAKLAAFDRDAAQVFPFLMPLAIRGGGYKHSSLLPVPFAGSLKIVYEHKPEYPWYFYSLWWARYPAAGAPATFSPAAMQAREAEVRQTAAAWRAAGKPPFLYPDAQPASGTLQIPPRSSVDLWQAAGPGTLVQLRLRAKPWNRAVGRLLLLRAWWDGEARPSVEVPLGDLCGGYAGAPFGAMLPVGRRADGWYYVYYPMPYASGARLALQNLSRYAVPQVEWEAVTRPGAPDPAAGRFCARFKHDKTIADTGVFELLSATGAGKLVGYNLCADGFRVPLKDFRREGRMALYVDGEAEASLAGFGLLAYWNHGWYGGPDHAPPLIVTQELDTSLHGTFSSARCFLTDAPTWTASARLVMETKLDDLAGRDFTSTVLWYRAVGGADNLPAPTLEALALPVRHYPGSVEAEDLARTAQFTGGDLTVVPDPDGRYGLGNNAFLSYAPLSADDRLALRVTVEQAGEYDLFGRLLWGPSNGEWGLAVNGAEVPDKQLRLWCRGGEEPGVHPAGWWALGRFTLPGGVNTLTFLARAGSKGVPQRGNLLGLDALRLVPVAKPATG